LISVLHAGQRTVASIPIDPPTSEKVSSRPLPNDVWSLSQTTRGSHVSLSISGCTSLSRLPAFAFSAGRPFRNVVTYGNAPRHQSRILSAETGTSFGASANRESGNAGFSE
jgi:hypothetical protein